MFCSKKHLNQLSSPLLPSTTQNLAIASVRERSTCQKCKKRRYRRSYSVTCAEPFFANMSETSRQILGNQHPRAIYVGQKHSYDRTTKCGLLLYIAIRTQRGVHQMGQNASNAPGQDTKTTTKISQTPRPVFCSR